MNGWLVKRMAVSNERIMAVAEQIRERVGVGLRFWSKVDKTINYPCWQWTANKSLFGYGNFGVSEKGNHANLRAHRLSYIAFIGPIPNGLQLDHLCRNPSCVNPHHLEAVTLAENVLRGQGVTAMNKRKTRCANGHELDGDNIQIVHRKDGIRRKCLVCQKHYNEMRYK